jgi:hypothetical protein
VSPTAAPAIDVTNAVVVVTPEVMTLAPGGRVAVSGDGEIEAHAARAVDADAWVSLRSATFITGMPTWDELSKRDATRVEPEPSPSPSPSGSPSPSAEPSPSPSPSAEADGDEDVAEIERGSSDIWRTTWRGTDRLSIAVDSIPPGTTVVFETVDGSALGAADMLVYREVTDGWITPLIWWGAVLAVIGAIALIFLFLDLRPVQARAETWLARRGRIGSGTSEVVPGSRRDRRRAGAAVPTADLEDSNAAEAPADESDSTGVADAVDTTTPEDEEKA